MPKERHTNLAVHLCCFLPHTHTQVLPRRGHHPLQRDRRPLRQRPDHLQVPEQRPTLPHRKQDQVGAPDAAAAAGHARRRPRHKGRPCRWCPGQRGACVARAELGRGGSGRGRQGRGGVTNQEGRARAQVRSFQGVFSTHTDSCVAHCAPLLQPSANRSVYVQARASTSLPTH
jgi:hypothetical protein